MTFGRVWNSQMLHCICLFTIIYASHASSLGIQLNYDVAHLSCNLVNGSFCHSQCDAVNARPSQWITYPYMLYIFSICVSNNYLLLHTMDTCMRTKLHDTKLHGN